MQAYTGPTVQLELSMPHTSLSSYAVQALPPDADYEEEGIGLENEIRVNPLDLHVFVFDKVSGKYIGQAIGLTCKKVPNSLTRSVVSGKLPSETLGKQVTLVLMANYEGRQATPIAPASTAVSLRDWLSQNTFDYSRSRWTYKETYLPMSGHTHLTVQSASTLSRPIYGVMELTRAIAQVRIALQPSCTDQLSGITVNHARRVSYSLRQAQGTVVYPDQQPLDLRFEALQLSAGQSHSFYIPEQVKGAVTLSLQFNDGKTFPIEFARYVHNQPAPNSHYPIQRNYIYQYNISRKPNSTFDVETTVMPWVTHDINTDFN